MTAAAGALLGYIELTQKGNMPRLRPVQAVTGSGYMEIDQATRRSLEIIRTLSGDCLLYTSPSPRDRQKCRMPSSA